MTPASPPRLHIGRALGTIAIAGATADVWFAWVPDHSDHIDWCSRELLSVDEQDHLRGYRIRESAERYVVTRSLVRTLLADRLGMAPRAVPVSRTDTGKPIVADGLHFNLSHSGDLILMAVSPTRAVGVDVERKREVRKVEALIARWLSDAEQLEVERLRANGAAHSDAFLRIWSLKEARLKALGVGISGSSRADFTNVHARPLDALLERLASEHPGSDFVGAIAFA